LIASQQQWRAKAVSEALKEVGIASAREQKDIVTKIPVEAKGN
jgi:hypothetical protein